MTPKPAAHTPTRRYTFKTSAQQKARYAVRTGKLKREPCVKCRAISVHGHHYDYSKPLSVIWLCATCHQREHAAMITHCPKGHAYDASNTYQSPSDKDRHCKQCVRDRAREYQRNIQMKANALGLSSRKFKAIAKAEK